MSNVLKFRFLIYNQMPLDGHSYLISQGWSGKGTGLREGAIARPLAVPQKKTLAGLGKDRDDAFPFWDHVFSAAAKAIQIKVFDDDCDSEAQPSLQRTSTGILCHRRPITGTPATTSGHSTPDLTSVETAQISQLTLLAATKREAAKRNLYSRFFRGPIIGPESETSDDTGSPAASCVSVTAPTKDKRKHKNDDHNRRTDKNVKVKKAQLDEKQDIEKQIAEVLECRKKKKKRKHDDELGRSKGKIKQAFNAESDVQMPKLSGTDEQPNAQGAFAKEKWRKTRRGDRGNSIVDDTRKEKRRKKERKNKEGSEQHSTCVF